MAIFRVAVLSLLLSLSALGQGLPPFHTIQNIGIDSIDLSNLNVVVNAPVRDKTSVIPFSFQANVNSLVTKDLLGHYVPSSSPRIGEPHLGGLADQITHTNCPGGSPLTLQYTNFVYIDGNGTGISFPAVKWDSQHCLTEVLSQTDQLSGLTLVINNGPTVYDKNGGTHTPSTFIDANGNAISANGSVLTDPLTTTATPTLSISQSGAQYTYTYTDAGGNPEQVSLSAPAATFQVACGTAAFTGVSPITNIAYPDNSTVQFTYEPSTPGSPNITTRLASVKLRTGGTVTYAYSGGTNGSGFNCVDGTTAVMKRTFAGGQWTYSHTPPNANNVMTTTVTDPAGNDTVYTFLASGFEIYRQVYQGHASGGTLLYTQGTCYNSAAPNCSAQTTVASKITQIDVYKYVPGVTNPAVVKTSYDSTFANVTDVKSYDFGAASPTTETVITYGSYVSGNCNSVDTFIEALPCTITVKDGTGAMKAQTRNTYDSDGNLLSSSRWVSGSTYLTTSATYNANGSVLTQTDAKGTVTTFSNFTCNGLLPQNISVAGLTSSQTWDCNGGVLTSSTDANSQPTTYSYTYTNTDDAGVVDHFWRLKAVTDPTGIVTDYQFNPSTNFQSPPMVGARLTINSSSEDFVRTYMDTFGRPYTKHKIAPGTSSLDTVSYTYDTNSRLASTSMPCSAGYTQTCPTPPATTYTYDALNRPLTVADGGGGTTTYSYSKNDVLITVGPTPVGENTKKKQYEYDGLGRLTSVCEITAASGSGSCAQSNPQTGFLTKYTYDALSNLTGVTQNAQAANASQQTRAYTYDGLSRLKTESNPETGLTQYFYDTAPSTPGTACAGTSNGDRVKKYDANGNTTCFTYDALHRVKTITYPSGPNSAATPAKTFDYDSSTFSCPAAVQVAGNVAGRLAEAYTGPSTSKITDVGFCYSPRGEVTDVFESTPHSAGTYHTTAVYAGNGILQSLSGIPSIPTTTYGLDGKGRWTTAQQGTTSLVCDGSCSTSSTTYNPAGQPLTINIGGFTDNDTYTYDNNTGRMSSFAFTVGATPTTLQGTLTWNGNGTLQTLAINDGFHAGDTQTCNYLYDDLARLGTPPGSSSASVNCGSVWQQTFAYDAFGNLTKSGSLSWNPGYNTKNQYTLGGTSYDLNGNLLNDSFNNYTWDADGHPATIDSSACGTNGTCLTYDALGRMVEKNVSGTFSEVLYSPIGKSAIMTGQTLTGAYIPLPGGASMFQTTGGKHFYHKDWLGSVRLSTLLANRALAFGRAFAPFGENYAQIGGGNELNFTGDTQDTINGLFDTPNRELHPNQGRWISPDPAGLDAADPADPQSWNLYAYVKNNPLSFTDNSGLWRDFTTFRLGQVAGWQTTLGSGPCIVSAFCSLGADDPDFSLDPSDLLSFEFFLRPLDLLPGERSLNWPIGSGNPITDIWQDALGLPTIPCQAQAGPWCDPSKLPNPLILDERNNDGLPDCAHNPDNIQPCFEGVTQQDLSYLKDRLGDLWNWFKGSSDSKCAGYNATDDACNIAYMACAAKNPTPWGYAGCTAVATACWRANSANHPGCH